MTMDRVRRDRFAAQPIPLTWEIPAAILAVALLLAAGTPLVVQGIAVKVLTGSFAWPDGRVPEALIGLIGGQFGRGIAPSAASALPGDGVMWTISIASEVVVLVLAVVGGLWVRDLVAGQRVRHGLAVRSQAVAALGIARLRANASVVRPDLYAGSRVRRSRMR